MLKNVASQKIGAQLVSATDGSSFTGTVTVSITGDAGTQATGTVGSGVCTHEGNGYHTYAPSKAETNYDLVAFTFTGSGAVPVTVQVFTQAGAKLSALTEVSVPALDDLTYEVDVSDTTDSAYGTSRKLTLGRLLGVLSSVCQGRLTLTTNVPVTTADVSGATTIYFTPYNGNLVSLYDGTRWKMYTFTQRSLALGTLTDAKNYDVFLYDNSGTLTLEFLAWSTNTARATELVLQDGVYCKTGDLLRRYLGTFRTTSTTTTEDSGGGTVSQTGGKRFLWNAHNRVQRPLAVIDTSNNWTYATNVWQQANAASGNKVECVIGLSAEVTEATVYGNGYGTGIAGGVGIGVDATNSNSAKTFQQLTTDSNAPLAHYCGYPGIGYHYLAWIEIARVGTITFQGDDGVNNLQSGLQAKVWG